MRFIGLSFDRPADFCRPAMTDFHARVLCPATEIGLECANAQRGRKGRTLLVLATYTDWYVMHEPSAKGTPKGTT